MAVAADTTEAAAAVEAAVTTAEVAVADRIVEAAEVTQAVVDVAEQAGDHSSACFIFARLVLLRFQRIIFLAE